MKLISSDPFSSAGVRQTWDKEIKVHALVTLDPIRLIKPTYDLKTNVLKFRNYYQTRGGVTTITHINSTSPYNATGQVTPSGNGWSEHLTGSKLDADSIANRTIEIDVTTDANWKNKIIRHELNAPTWGQLEGKDVEHSSLPWFMYDQAVQDLS